MPQVILQFIANDMASHEQEAPKLLASFDSHQLANKFMQHQYDAKLKEVNDSYPDYDDSEASHFYIAGDDGTFNWWII